MSKPRDANTDLLRATAILAVLLHHITQFLPAIPEVMRPWLEMGGYGVDLFFVLSGWLIGGLYFTEQKELGEVSMGRFWLRRWMRTLPPYFVVMPVAFLTVYLTRRESFDWRYLVFVQNYEEKLPYYLISWSLCVEEHFYLVLPILLLALRALRAPLMVVLPLIALLSMGARIMLPVPGADAPFGFAFTATHLRLEGLALGVWCAHLSKNRPELWLSLQRIVGVALIPCIVAAATIPMWSSALRYQCGFTLVAITCTVLLVRAVSVPSLTLAKTKFISCAALWSYSIYLTHSIVLNAGLMGAEKLGWSKELLAPIWLMVMFAAGALGYRLIELPAMRLRDRLFPRRARPAPETN